MFTEWPYEKSVLDKVHELSDGIVRLSAIEEKVIFRQYFKIQKLRWGKISSKRYPFKIFAPGGIKIYIPKVLVIGPFNAGKTSFIHTASSSAISVDRRSTTVALDYGHVRYKGFSVDLFGTPGQERFDPILRQLGGEALGVILIVDATKPETFPRAREMIKESKTLGLPYVLVANKANLKNALSPEEIREIFALPENVSIIPTTADNLKFVREGTPCKLKSGSVNKVLDILLDTILERGYKNAG